MNSPRKGSDEEFLPFPSTESDSSDDSEEPPAKRKKQQHKNKSKSKNSNAGGSSSASVNVTKSITSQVDPVARPLDGKSDMVIVDIFFSHKSTNSNPSSYDMGGRVNPTKYKMSVLSLADDVEMMLVDDGVPKGCVKIERVAIRMKGEQTFENVTTNITLADYINDSIEATPKSNNINYDSNKLTNNNCSESESDDESSPARTFGLEMLVQISKSHIAVAKSNSIELIIVKLLGRGSLEASGRTLAVTDGKNSASTTRIKMSDLFGTRKNPDSCKALTYSMVKAVIGYAYTKSNRGELMSSKCVFALQTRVAQKTAYVPFECIGDSNVPQNNKFPLWSRLTNSVGKDEITITATIALTRESVTVEKGGKTADELEGKLAEIVQRDHNMYNNSDDGDDDNWPSLTPNDDDDNDNDNDDNDNNNNVKFSGITTIEEATSRSRRAKSQSAGVTTQASILSLYKDPDSRNPLYHGFNRNHIPLLIATFSAHNFKPGDYSFVPLLESSNFTPGSLPDLGRDHYPPDGVNEIPPMGTEKSGRGGEARAATQATMQKVCADKSKESALTQILITQQIEQGKQESALTQTLITLQIAKAEIELQILKKKLNP